MNTLASSSIFGFRCGAPYVRPLAFHGVRAGFPSPADDYTDASLDLVEHLVRNKTATFFMRVDGDSMQGAGILDGDLLVVDRSIEVRDGCTVIAVVGNGFTVKRYRSAKGRVWLEPDNPKYSDIEVTSDDMIWGVVTHSIHSL